MLFPTAGKKSSSPSPTRWVSYHPTYRTSHLDRMVPFVHLWLVFPTWCVLFEGRYVMVIICLSVLPCAQHRPSTKELPDARLCSTWMCAKATQHVQLEMCHFHLAGSNLFQIRPFYFSSQEILALKALNWTSVGQIINQPKPPKIISTCMWLWSCLRAGTKHGWGCQWALWRKPNRDSGPQCYAQGISAYCVFLDIAWNKQSELSVVWQAK